MSFEQTTVFYNLVNAFKRYGNDIKNDTTRTEKAALFAERFVRLYGQEKIQKVKAKANSALKAKIF